MQEEEFVKSKLRESIQSQKAHHKSGNLRGELENNVAIQVLSWVLNRKVIWNL